MKFRKRSGMTFGLSAIVIGILWAASGLNAQAQSELAVVARVIALRGGVSAENDQGEVRQLALKQPIYKGDIIRTGERGRAQLEFPDRTVVSIGRRTEIEIAESYYLPEQRDGAFIMDVKEGVFRVMGGAITEIAPDKFKARTPTATIGVRGSFFQGRLSGQALTVVFLGGKGIYVENIAGLVEIDIPGFGTIVPTPAAAPTVPARVPATEWQEMLAPFAAESEDADEDPTDETATTDGSGGSGTTAGAAGSTGDEPGVEEPLAAGTATETGGGGGSTSDSGSTGGTGVSDPIIRQDSNLQSDLSNTIEDTTTATIYRMVGNYQAILKGPDPAGGADDQLYRGPTVANATGGVVDGQATTASGNFPFRLQTVAVDPTGSYTSYAKIDNNLRQLTLRGAPRDIVFDYAFDNLGEFAVFAGDFSTFTDGLDTYLFSEMGYAGIPTLTVPTGGVYVYSGPSLFSVDQGPLAERYAGMMDVKLLANFRNHKVMAVMSKMDSTSTTTGGPTGGGSLVGGTTGGVYAPALAIVYGDISGNQIVNGKIIGSWVDVAPQTLDGVVADGDFFGHAAQGVGFVAESTLRDLATQQSTGAYLQTGAAYLQDFKTDPGTGIVSWLGMAVGVAENINAPSVSPQFLIGASVNDLEMVIDRGLGVIGGRMSLANAFDFSPAALSLDQVVIGGSYGSAYIIDKALVAELGGTNVVRSSSLTGGLKATGNYLWSGPPEAQISAWVQWGYWELGYDDPMSGETHHAHVTGCYWLAGQATPLTYLQGLATSSAVGNYSGQAFCTEILSGAGQHESFGTADLTVQFAPRTVNGSLQFPNVTFNLSGTVDTAAPGFTGVVSGVKRGTGTFMTPSSSRLTGGFFGPQADSAAGSFAADMGATDSKFTGGFITNRTSALP